MRVVAGRVLLTAAVAVAPLSAAAELPAEAVPPEAIPPEPEPSEPAPPTVGLVPEDRRLSTEEMLALEQGKIPPPDRIIGIAQVGIGWLTLPRALVCGEGNVCRQGDTTPFVEAWNLVRLDYGFAFGAGITLGLIPTTDAPREDPPGIERSHRRGYMTIEPLVRYYPWRTPEVEGWVGAGAGLVIVSDRFVSNDADQRYAFVGTPGTTLRTEGLSLLAGFGVSVVLSEAWTLGFTGRAGMWRLPRTPETSPFGDEASLSGSNSVIYAGISLAFQQVL
jgi:hypothetical protein